jgi:hypothetical protein
VPVLAVAIDRRIAAAVPCDRFHVVNARVAGSLVETQFATVELSASTHPEVGEGTYLTWLNEVELQPGQVVTVQFLSNGDVIGVGRTIEELFPEDHDGDPNLTKSVEECFRESRQAEPAHGLLVLGRYSRPR